MLVGKLIIGILYSHLHTQLNTAATSQNILKTPLQQLLSELSIFIPDTIYTLVTKTLASKDKKEHKPIQTKILGNFVVQITSNLDKNCWRRSNPSLFVAAEEVLCLRILEGTAGNEVDPYQHNHSNNENHIGFSPFFSQVPQ